MGVATFCRTTFVVRYSIHCRKYAMPPLHPVKYFKIINKIIRPSDKKPVLLFFAGDAPGTHISEMPRHISAFSTDRRVFRKEVRSTSLPTATSGPPGRVFLARASP